MQPEDDQAADININTDNQPINSPLSNTDENSEFNEELSIVNSVQAEQNDQPESISANQPITPVIPQNIYPDPSDPSQPRPVPGSLTIEPVQSKKGKKGLIIGLIIVGVLAVLGGGLVSAYTFWYSNPNKVISDALINTITAKTAIYAGNINVDSDNTKVKVSINTQTSGSTGSLDAKLTMTSYDKDYSANGSGMIDSAGDLYFKVDITKIAAELRSSYKSYLDKATLASYDKLVSQVNNKWVKVSSSDLAEYNKTYSTTKDCVNDTVKKYKDDKAAVAEITDLYSKQNFIVVDKNLGQKNGSLGYQLKTDKTKLTEFAKGLKDTKIYKSISACDSSYSVDDALKSYDNTDSDPKTTSTVELWVDSWSHQMTKLSLKAENSDTKISSEFLTKFNQKVNVTAPKDSINISQLKTYIEDFTNSIYGSSDTTN